MLFLLTTLRISHPLDNERSEGGRGECFRLKMWRTVPLVEDSNLTEGAVTLGMSSPAEEVSAIDAVSSEQC